MHSKYSLLFLLVVLHFSRPSSAASFSFIYGGCSQQRYNPTSAYQSNLDSLLTSLANAAYSTLYTKFSMKPANGDPSSAVSGLFQCRGDLSSPDCLQCVQDAVNQLHLLCLDAAGAAIQLDSCFVKYDNATFLGQLDTSLLYRKCSSQMGYDSQFFARRDDMFGQLNAGNGLFFKTSSADGIVQGMAQCVGDLSRKDCATCITDAVSKAKEVCGAAIAGDLFLGKCYVRYAASGFYTRSPSGSGSRDQDEAGKTLAIIIGLFAGVALIIVFASFLRKVCNNGDNNKG